MTKAKQTYKENTPFGINTKESFEECMRIHAMEFHEWMNKRGQHWEIKDGQFMVTEQLSELYEIFNNKTEGNE